MKHQYSGPALSEQPQHWLAFRRVGWDFLRLVKHVYFIGQTVCDPVSSGRSVRSLGIAELGSFYVQVRVDPDGNVTDLCPNILAFAVTIGPDKQGSTMSGIRLDVSRYAFLILRHRCINIWRLGCSRVNWSHIVNRSHYRSLKKLRRTARLPASISGVKVCCVDMAGNAGHCNIASTPWLIERELEFIVLQPAGSSAISLLRSE